MLKKIFNLSVISVTLFCFNCNAYAYEYINQNNEDLVRDKINEIYDLKQQYEDLLGGYVETVEVHTATSNSYWWPIGSNETTESNGKIYAKGAPATTIITSYFGYRENPFNPSETVFHSGMDIAGGNGPGDLNVVAAKDGVVVYPTANVANDCPSSTSESSCGGGYGNYVIIQHSDGNFTLYGHLYENSITVTAGDSVEQGQVIGKMGSSGNSTGAHLHFEVREGQNVYSSTVDPSNYISMDNPRYIAKTTTEGDFVAWLHSWEGYTTIEGDSYLVVDIGDGVRTVGSGVTLENNIERFKQYGINIDDYPVGSKISIEIVDQIELEIIGSKRSYIENVLANNSLTLQENEIQALISQMYNIGNINGFVDAYKQYGNTDEFYNNWFFRNVMEETIFEAGLTRRRNSEWALFHNGEYIFN